jgi:hypothetical protein
MVAYLLSLRANAVWFLVPLVLFTLAAFSHETAALSLPAFVFVLWQGRISGVFTSAQTIWLVAGWSWVSALALIITLLHPGTPDQSNIICKSLIDLGSTEEACAGAISVIGQSFTNAIQAMSTQFPGYLAYVPLALLALVPFLLLRAPNVIWLLLLVSYIALIPLFMTGIDYGRWIYLATSLVSIAFLAIGQQRPSRAFKVPFLMAIVYISVWSLPYTGPLVQEPLFRFFMVGPLGALFG